MKHLVKCLGRFVTFSHAFNTVFCIWVAVSSNSKKKKELLTNHWIGFSFPFPFCYNNKNLVQSFPKKKRSMGRHLSQLQSFGPLGLYTVNQIIFLFRSSNLHKSSTRTCHTSTRHYLSSNLSSWRLSSSCSNLDSSGVTFSCRQDWGTQGYINH